MNLPPAPAADPRVLELELLAQLELHDGLLEFKANAHASWGVRPQHFRDLVYMLLCEGCVTGGEPRLYAVTNTPDLQAPLHHANQTTLASLLGEQPYFIRITHQGRVRLARLREELDRGRVMDATGILIDGRHIARDLRIRLASRGPTDPFRLLMADLDSFKRVNDRQGYSRGDEALGRYFGVLRDIVSVHEGEAYRRGGDETVAVLPQRGGPEAEGVANSLCSTLRQELLLFADPGLGTSPTVSIGVLTLQRSCNPAECLAEVEALLRRAKLEGKDRWVSGILA